MDVGIITPRYPPNTRGGGEVSAKLLAEQLLEELDYTTTVHSFDGNSRETVNGVNVIRHGNLPQIPELASILSVMKISDIEDHDILHGYNMELHPLVGFLSKMTSKPTVAHLNSYTYIDKRDIGMDLHGKEKAYNNILRPVSSPIIFKFISYIDELVAISDTINQIYSPHVGTNISTVSNMVDPSFTPDKIDTKMSETPKILYVGSVNNHKGVGSLLNAVEYVDREVELIIVGGGNKLNEVRKEASSMNDIDTRIVGHVEYSQVAQYYSESDIFVHPGKWPEPFGRTILEAMQYGLTVVSTNIGGPSEVIEDSRLLAEPGEPKNIANAIDYAIENRKRIGRQQHNRVVQKYSPSSVLSDLEDIYNRA
ncbi:glycosyltransferase family 4 protein [Halorubrum sp. DM2]|uniref:glycosyltransferase family 4 protein n=1 Tax=Halorubrum sp. DM2 TaxID=2527867 RepID=UPI0024B68BEA|nr:glycosyltransferase family 4 protein [Halorubrum sp. DM2]